MASFPNTSRRTFRGRAGPTDRRLPKYEARRRKHHTEPGGPEKNFDDDDGLDGEIVGDKADLDDDEEEVTIVEKVTVVKKLQETKEEQLRPPEDSSPAGKEIKHLLKRISNVSESISLSGAAISNPTTWTNNVLNAVQNSVQEWRAILNHYDDGLEDAQVKAPALATYMLVQQAMQSGPLTGSTPGYFKRCGVAVATHALLFLIETVPNGMELRFTEKQSQAIEKWKVLANKAVESGKPPTKSQIKKQEGKKKKK